MRRTIGVAGLCVLAAAAGYLPVSSASATVAKAAIGSPGWHVSTKYPAADGVWSDLVSSSGQGNSWSLWQACGTSACTGTGLFSYLKRWDGSAWKNIPVPSALAADASTAVTLASDSPTDAWLFTSSGVVLRWNGSKLTAHPIPSWVVRLSRNGLYYASAQVFGPNNVWVFSAGFHICGPNGLTCPDKYVSRYHHGRWTKSKLPVAPLEVSALSASNIWVLSQPSGTDSRYKLAHWNGQRWSTVSVPTVQVPKNSVEYVGNLAADTKGDVWLTRNINTGTQGGRTLYLMRWAAGHWHRVYFRKPTSNVSYLASDGHGGVWLADNGPRPNYTWYLDHYNAGQWQRDSVPAVQGTSLLDLISLTWIPGTRSVWAGANDLIPNASQGIVGSMLKYRY